MINPLTPSLDLDFTALRACHHARGADPCHPGFHHDPRVQAVARLIRSLEHEAAGGCQTNPDGDRYTPTANDPYAEAWPRDAAPYRGYTAPAIELLPGDAAEREVDQAAFKRLAKTSAPALQWPVGFAGDLAPSALPRGLVDVLI